MNEFPIDEEALVRAEASYTLRLPLLQALAHKLEAETKELLEGTPKIDRIGFRAKTAKSYAKKSLTRKSDGSLKYGHPLEEIEDQVGGRVLVFFRSDIETVAKRLAPLSGAVEHVRKQPLNYSEFSYESDHYIFQIPPSAKPPGWSDMEDMPQVFEMQVRTLFMHAWAEPSHDVAYKEATRLTPEEWRKLAWAASSAWGGDEIFEQLVASIAARKGVG